MSDDTQPVDPAAAGARAAVLHLSLVEGMVAALRHIVDSVPAASGLRALVSRLEGQHAELQSIIVAPPPAPPGPEPAPEPVVKPSDPGPQPDHTSADPAPADPEIHDGPDAPEHQY